MNRLYAKQYDIDNLTPDDFSIIVRNIPTVYGSTKDYLQYEIE